MPSSRSLGFSFLSFSHADVNKSGRHVELVLAKIDAKALPQGANTQQTTPFLSFFGVIRHKP